MRSGLLQQTHQHALWRVRGHRLARPRSSNLSSRNAFVIPVFDHGLNLRCHGRIAFQQIDQGQGNLACQQIHTGSLAQRIVSRGEVEQIVCQLKGGSEIHSINRAWRFAVLSSLAPPMIAPISQQAEKRNAVFLCRMSKYSSLRNIAFAEHRQLNKFAFGHLSRDAASKCQESPSERS